MVSNTPPMPKPKPLGNGGSVTVVAGGDNVMDFGTPSPAAVEAARLRKAEKAMMRFCSDLNGLIGRVIVPPEMREGMDPLTSEIYDAAIEAGLDYNSVLAGDSPLDTPSWMANAARVLAKLRRNVPESTYQRVLEVQKGEDHDDPDAKYALDYAEGYFDTGTPQADELVDLATCLLDFGFTRQGLDDDLVRQKKDELEEVTLKEEPEPKPTPASSKEELLKQYERLPFVKSVKEALLDWKGSLFDKVWGLRPSIVYRIAMVHAGLPTGDELAKRCYSGTLQHKRKHPSRLVTLGHAAIALQQLVVERGGDPDFVSYQLVKDFCRTCGNFLGDKRHGCCITDAMKQANEIKYLDSLAQLGAMLDFGSSLYGPRPGDESISKEKGFLLRRTTLEDGDTKYEVHVIDIWDKGIWQEVKDRAAGERLAKRIIDEHKKAKALVVKEPEPKPVVFEQTSTDQLSGADYGMPPLQTVVAPKDSALGAQIQEVHALAQLGRSVKWLATILCAGGLLLTGKVIFIPVLLVGWVMAYALIDKKAIEKRARVLEGTEPKALPKSSDS